MKSVKELFRPLRMLAAVAVMLGTGCSLVTPGEFYQLQADTVATASKHGDTAVLLGPVKLADYLQREQILQRQADGRLTASSNGRWAGSLDDEVGQLLLRQLAAQLGSSHVALYPDRIGVKPGAQLVVSISRLDSGVGQPAVLEAQWRLLDAGGTVRDSRVLTLEAQHGDELSSQVQAQSKLLVELSGQLAEAVRQLQDSRRKPAQGAAARIRDESADNTGQETMQLLERFPELEVFRF